MLLDDDLTRLRHIRDAAKEGLGYVAGLDVEDFRKRRPLQHSVVRCIKIFGEATARLSAELKESNAFVPWQDMVGMRNRVIHAYFDIDIDVVWKTAKEDFPVLLTEVDRLTSAQEEAGQ